MKRVYYDVDKFTLTFGREAAKYVTEYGEMGGPVDEEAFDEQSIEPAHENDAASIKFSDEMFARLYLGEPPEEVLDPSQRDPVLGPWSEGYYRNLEMVREMSDLALVVNADATGTRVALGAYLKVIQPMLPKNPGGKSPLVDVDMRNTMRRGIEAALKAHRDFAQWVDALGLTGGSGAGARRDLSPKENAKALKLAAKAKHNDRLRRILEMAGKFKETLRARHTKRVTQANPEEITNIEQGAELARVLPAEMSRLLRPALRYTFFKDFTERQLLQYEMAGVEPVAKGPFILVADKSGSMKGTKDEWTTALSLAINWLAQEEKREFVYVPFGGGVHTDWVRHVKPGDPLDPDFLTLDANDSATDIAQALDYSLRQVEKAKNEKMFKDADIILITDGGSSAELAQDIRDRAEKDGTRIVAIGIGESEWETRSMVVSRAEWQKDNPTTKPSAFDGLEAWTDDYRALDASKGELENDMADLFIGPADDGTESRKQVPAA